MLSFLSLLIFDSVAPTGPANGADDATETAEYAGDKAAGTAPLVLAPGEGIDMVAAEGDAGGPAAGVVTISLDAGALEQADPQAMTQMGFRTALVPGAELELNIDKGIAGEILCLEVETDLPAEDGLESFAYSLRVYLMPAGATLPENPIEGTEVELITQLGLQKLGELDLGQYQTTVPEGGGAPDVVQDTRQIDLPKIVTDRPITELDAFFT